MRNLVQVHSMYTGGIICGEVKLATTLRMLAGGLYLDLSIILAPVIIILMPFVVMLSFNGSAKTS